MTDCFITIVGGGIVGNAIAYELKGQFSEEIICLLERNTLFPGENQTSRNSGVVHAGIYYDKQVSPFKARFCVEGNALLYAFCADHDLPVRNTGKLIVATNESEHQTLISLLERSKENTVPDVEMISGSEVKAYEPNVEAHSALWVPTSGVVDPTSMVSKLRDLAGLDEFFLVGTTATNITPTDEGFLVEATTEDGELCDFTTKYVVNAAGLYCEDIARMVNPDFPLTLFPVRGEYAKFYQTRSELSVGMNVYPTPITFPKPNGSAYTTLGVHLTPTFAADSSGECFKEDGLFALAKEVAVGPMNRRRGDIGREDYGSDLAPLDDFFSKIRRFFPGVNLDDLQLHQTGIQAVIANSNDYHIARDTKHPGMLNVVGICSPGLTSALAIAKYVREIFNDST